MDVRLELRGLRGPRLVLEVVLDGGELVLGDGEGGGQARGPHLLRLPELHEAGDRVRGVFVARVDDGLLVRHEPAVDLEPRERRLGLVHDARGLLAQPRRAPHAPRQVAALLVVEVEAPAPHLRDAPLVELVPAGEEDRCGWRLLAL